MLIILQLLIFRKSTSVDQEALGASRIHSMQGMSFSSPKVTPLLGLNFFLRNVQQNI